MKRFESQHQEQADTKPNTWGWATNLAEKVRRSKLAQFAGRLLLADYQPPVQARLEAQSASNTLTPGYSIVEAPTPIQAWEAEGYKKEGRFETPAERNARMEKFTAEHPTADVAARHYFEFTGQTPPPQQTVGNTQPPDYLLAGVSAHQMQSLDPTHSPQVK